MAAHPPPAVARATDNLNGASSPTLGTWTGTMASFEPPLSARAIADLLADLGRPVFAVSTPDGPRITADGTATLGTGQGALPLIGFAPPVSPEGLGDGTFAATYGARYAYMAGSMANGIASVELVRAAVAAGFVASYGAAGQTLEAVRASVAELVASLPRDRICVNLIHSPSEPETEDGLVDLLLSEDITAIEASAFLKLTAPVVRYRLRGAYRDDDGRVRARNRIIAKASRVEVATHWLSSPPPNLVEALLSAGRITEDEAALAPMLAMADDLTAEADSGGHTDNQPAIAQLPTFIALRDRLQPGTGGESGQARTRIGAGGGISTPAAIAAAFAMGAAYVVTGSINQACAESGSSERVREMLANASQGDVIMAPAADMFEMGVKLQVLKRGTLFAMRAARLYELYRTYPSLDAIPIDVRETLERDIFKASLNDIWAQTHEFFSARSPEVLERAQTNPKQKMALVFRWYLGLSSRWANQGVPDRQADYQIWCGPAMGAFNEWAHETYLASADSRTVGGVGHALLDATCAFIRAQAVARCGIALPSEATTPKPRPDAFARTHPQEPGRGPAV